MPKQETQARVRCFTRQIDSLRDELRREGKRSAWALERLKEKESRIKALETKVSEQALVNSRLAHELTSVEEAQKTTITAKDAEIETLKDETKQRDERNRSCVSASIRQITCVVRELLRLENVLGTRRSKQGLSVAGKVEKMIGQIAQKLLTASDTLKSGQSNLDNDNDCAAYYRGEDLHINDHESSNVQKILTTYRRTVSRLRDQVTSIDKLLKDSREEKDRLKKTIDELQNKAKKSEGRHTESIRLKQQENDDLHSAIRTLRETSTQRLKRIEDLESEASKTRQSNQTLKKGLMKKSEKIESLEQFIAQQRKSLSAALEAVTSRSTKDDCECEAEATHWKAATIPDLYNSRSRRVDDRDRNLENRLVASPAPDDECLDDRASTIASSDCFHFADNEIAELERAFKEATATDTY